MGYMATKRELPIAWETLVKVSEFCLTVRMEGFVKAELIKQLPDNYTWRLWTEDWGEFGNFVVARLGRPGKTGVFFTGLDPDIDFTDDERKTKEVIFQQIIDSYFWMLDHRIIWKNNGDELILEEIILTSPVNYSSGDEQERKEIFLPSEDKERRKDVEKFAHQGMTISQIASTVGVSMSTVKRDLEHLKIIKRKRKR